MAAGDVNEQILPTPAKLVPRPHSGGLFKVLCAETPVRQQVLLLLSPKLRFVALFWLQACTLLLQRLPAETLEQTQGKLRSVVIMFTLLVRRAYARRYTVIEVRLWLRVTREKSTRMFQLMWGAYYFVYINHLT